MGKLKKSIFSPGLLLCGILVLAIFFHTYKIYEWMLYGHDQDLAAWIVKDIIVNHHFRLIGQETSITGLFIGGLYYYSLIPFFLLFGMHPIATMPTPIIIAILTTLSLYFVNTKLFNTQTGLISSLIYSVSINHNMLDRWSVPTQPTMLWAVWFMFTIFSLARGNLKVLPILLILISLIWHIHIAFVPLLILVPIALFLNRNNLKNELKKNIKLKLLGVAAMASLILIIPFVIFEVRHDFQQLHGLLQAVIDQKEKLSLLQRSYLVVQNFGMTFIFAVSPKLISINYEFALLNFTWPMFVFALYGIIFKFLYKKSILTKNESVVILVWLVIVFFGQVLTKRPISEYYFYNLLPLPILFISLFLSEVLKIKSLKKPICGILSIFVLFNLYYFTSLPPLNREYLNIEKTIKYIKSDSEKNNYRCFALNFFGEPGVGVGFRYPSWYFNLPLVRPTTGVPIYNIAVPPKTAQADEEKTIYGDFAIIPPQTKESFNNTLCQSPETQLLPPNGYTN